VQIRRVSFVGLRTDRHDAMTTFIGGVLGLPAGHREDDWAVFRLPSGNRDFVEVFRTGGGYDERLLPAEAGPLTVAFDVDDLDAARAELVAAGIELVGDIVWAAEAFAEPRYEGFGWLYFRAPDGTVLCLQQDHAP